MKLLYNHKRTIKLFEACILDEQYSIKIGLRYKLIWCHKPNEKTQDAKLLP